MEKETKAIHTPFQKRDAYGALSFPVYNTVAYEFDSAHAMTEAFAGRVPEPDYSRVMNPSSSTISTPVMVSITSSIETTPRRQPYSSTIIEICSRFSSIFSHI